MSHWRPTIKVTLKIKGETRSQQVSHTWEHTRSGRRGPAFSHFAGPVPQWTPVGSHP
jgi:hypothetical protein